MATIKNHVELTMRVNKSTDKTQAIKKISDKLTIVNAWMGTGKDSDGKYNPALNFNLHIFGGEKNPTEIVGTLKEGDTIVVEGSLTARDNKGYKAMIINCSKVTVESATKETPTTPTPAPVPAAATAETEDSDVFDTDDIFG